TADTSIMRSLLFVPIIRQLPISTLFPYTTLFRSSNMNKLNPVNFEYTSRLLQEYIIKIRPTTIFLPWRKDPHPDHIATWNLAVRSEEHTSELQSRENLVCRLLLEKKKDRGAEITH